MYVNIIADDISAINVATAAPVTPMLNVKIRMGSNTAFSTFANKLIFRGVTVSIVPLKAENPIRENMDGKKAKPLIKRYGFANSRAGAPFLRTPPSKRSGCDRIKKDPSKAISVPTTNA
mmetsp:Transcript_4125/g.5397  ORF Transcript_4125/g.5397 Transcript_4125/m.5397 type:complete len:119 (-) Transcript_4125:153-509(-)